MKTNLFENILNKEFDFIVFLKNLELLKILIRFLKILNIMVKEMCIFTLNMYVMSF